MGYIDKISNSIKQAAVDLSNAGAQQKNEALACVIKSIDKSRAYILEQNKTDVKLARKNNMSDAMIDRLKLNDARIDEIIDGINMVISFNDPIGQSSDSWTLENGLFISKISVPIGVIAIIYEGRPNVTVDAFALALKSGNAVILRGSSSAMCSNIALENAIIEGLNKSKISKNVIHLVKDENREIVKEILTANAVVDLAIPRGGHELIQMVISQASVPTLQTGEGNNHAFVDESADMEMALKIIENAKLQRPSTCNALEKLLVHKNIANDLLPMLKDRLNEKLSFHVDKAASEILTGCRELTDDELSVEYLDNVLGIKIVNDIDEAILHINTYGTKHSECIITNNLSNALKFQKRVDASAVYVNASTRFTDGGQFGFGLEMGISTQKLHARGPVGLRELVTYKYLVMGDGQLRS